MTDRSGSGSRLGQVLARLQARGWRLAVAESATGGLLGHELTKRSGSSAVFWGGVLAYSNDVKSRLLDVDEDVVVRWGAVSPHVALAMAQGVRRAIDVEVALSITGIAGPTGATEYKPVGLYYIGVATPTEAWCWRHHFTEDRQGNNALAVSAALAHLLTVVA